MSPRSLDVLTHAAHHVGPETATARARQAHAASATAAESYGVGTGRMVHAFTRVADTVKALGALATPLHTADTLPVPEATAETRPALLTVAAAGALLVQAVGLQAAVELSEYVAVATSCCVAPVSRCSVAGDSVTEVMVGAAGGGGGAETAATVTAAPALVTPLQTAVIVLEPPAAAVTRPVLPTAAMAGALLLQAVGVQAFVDASEYTAVALNCCVPATCRVTVPGASTTCVMVGVEPAGGVAPLTEKEIGGLDTDPSVATTVP